MLWWVLSLVGVICGFAQAATRLLSVKGPSCCEGGLLHHDGGASGLIVRHPLDTNTFVAEELRLSRRRGWQRVSVRQ